MIVSMTGFGTASRTIKKKEINVEVRSINSKYLEVNSRMPMIFSDKDSEVKEILSQRITRGKITLNLTIDKSNSSGLTFKVHPDILNDCHDLLKNIKKTAGLKDEIKLEHILKFSEIFKPEETDEFIDYWIDIKKVIESAVSDLIKMKMKEGKKLEADIFFRINMIEKRINKVEKISARSIKDTKKKMTDKVNQLIDAASVETDNNRLEFELIMISDKMDITEELIRARSHISYFKKKIHDKELSGRRLNFLVQEINREINTIASKSLNSDISQLVVEMKEDLEKIKEQLQNVE